MGALVLACTTDALLSVGILLRTLGEFVSHLWTCIPALDQSSFNSSQKPYSLVIVCDQIHAVVLIGRFQNCLRAHWKFVSEFLRIRLHNKLGLEWRKVKAKVNSVEFVLSGPLVLIQDSPKKRQVWSISWSDFNSKVHLRNVTHQSYRVSSKTEQNTFQCSLHFRPLMDALFKETPSHFAEGSNTIRFSVFVSSGFTSGKWDKKYFLDEFFSVGSTLRM